MAVLYGHAETSWLTWPVGRAWLRQAGRLYCTSLNLRLKSPLGGGGCMIKHRLHLSPLPAVNTTKHLFYFFPHISSSVNVLKIRVPMAKHSFRDNCSIVLFTPYDVLLTSICYASMSPTTYPPMTHRPLGQIDRWHITFICSSFSFWIKNIPTVMFLLKNKRSSYRSVQFSRQPLMKCALNGSYGRHGR